jgi:hypothetical protein
MYKGLWINRMRWRTAMTLCQLLPAYLECSTELLPCADRGCLAPGLNRRDKRARYLRLLCQLLLCKLPVCAPGITANSLPLRVMVSIRINRFLLSLPLPVRTSRAVWKIEPS